MKGEIMNTTSIKHMPLKVGLAVAPLALMGLAAAPAARADSLIYAQTTLVSGTASTTQQFDVASAGKVSVSLESLAWPPGAMTSLSFAVTSASQVINSWSGLGGATDQTTFDVGPGTYFAHIMATANSALNLGLYSITMTFSPTTSAVPLPMSGWMLVTGMFVLAGLARAIRPSELTGSAAA